MLSGGRSAYGAIACTLALGLLIGWFLAQPSVTNSDASHDANRYACEEGDYRNCDTRPEVLYPVGQEPNAQSSEQKTYREEYRAEKDLKAQQWMAAWAMVMGIATCLTVGLVVLTLVEANVTAQAAIDATDAAWASEKSTRDIGQKQSMAYVHAIRAYIPKKVHSQNLFAKHTASIVVQFENIGKTIARKVDVSVALFEENNKMWSEYREVEYGKPFGISNIAPSQQPEITVINDLPSIIKENGWDSDEKSTMIFLTLRGEVRYEDVFDNKFRTSFVFVVMTARSLKTGLEEDTPCLHFATDIPAFELITETDEEDSED